MSALPDTLVPTAPLSHSLALKAASHATHERLDQRIMRCQPFASLPQYQRFLRLQWLFHWELQPLFEHAGLQALLPDLGERQRLEAVAQDLADLGAARPPAPARAPATAGLSLDEALGWFYVAEGSNLGAALLFKEAAALGLHAEHGARHLAGHPEGRLRHWRGFTSRLDALSLAPEQIERMGGACRTAFERVHALVAQELEC
jgi:heme oxygenase